MRKKEKAETIYRAALKVFAEYGFKKATVEEIARELDMTKGNLYLYAEDKQDLYRKCVEYALLCWQGHVREAVERETDVRQRFLVMCREAVKYLSVDGDFRRVLMRDPDIFPMFPESDPYRQINRNSMTMIKTILQTGMREGKFREVNLATVPQIIFSIYKMIIIQTYINAGGRSMQKMFEETLDLLTRGLFRESSRP